MPKLKPSEKELSIRSIEAAIHSSLAIKDWDLKHLAELLTLTWKEDCYQKLCRILRNPEKAKLGDVLDILRKLDLKIVVTEKGINK